MIRFRFLDVDKDWDWVRARIDVILCTDTRGLIAERDGVRVAAFIADNWSGNSVQVHQVIYDPLVLKHEFHLQLAHWIFGVCNRGVIIGLTPANNKRAIRLNKHFGFELLATVKDGYRVGVDYHIFELRREKSKLYQAWLARQRAEAA